MDTKPHALIIGAGFTGCALAHDLALRGFIVTVVERGEIASGTSGRTHGLLHSGGRYCVTDQEAAIECIEENIILRKIARQCIEFNGGLFIGLNDSDVEFAQRFAEGAQKCSIPIDELSPSQALKLEPKLNPDLRIAYTVPDGTFDPLRLALCFAAHARKNGAVFHFQHEVIGIRLNGINNFSGVIVLDHHTGLEKELSADILINATGAWVGKVAALAHAGVPVIPTPGVMVAYDRRVVNRVVNRLNEPGDGDILIPQRRMVVIGTTSFEASDVDYIPVVDDQVRAMRANAVELVPAIGLTHQRGAYMSARPLIQADTSGRCISRTFRCYDHAESDGIGNFVTITGGKATTCRAMAESTADLVCEKLQFSATCQTKEIVLISYRDFYHD